MANDNGVSRRDLVKGIGATGALSMPSIVGASDGETDISRTVTELDNNDRNRLISRARRNDEVRTADAALREDGWRPHISSATVLRIKGANRDSDISHEEYHVVTIPYQTKEQTDGDDTSETALFWIDISLESHGVPSTFAHSIQEKHNIRTEEFGPMIKTYTIEDGKLETAIRTAEPGSPAASATDVTPESCYCEVRGLECDGLSMWCIISIATGYVGTYWACGPCVADPTKATCAPCLLAAISSGAGTIGCANGINCKQVTTCMDRDEIPDSEQHCEVCSNIWYPNCGTDPYLAGR